MKENKDKLDEFGKFLMENLRDSAVSFAENIIKGKEKAQGLKKIQEEISKFSLEEKELIFIYVMSCLDGGIHDFLFALQEQTKIKILIDEVDIESLSDGLHGEIFTEEGWRARFSKYGENYTLIK